MMLMHYMGYISVSSILFSACRAPWLRPYERMRLWLSGQRGSKLLQEIYLPMWDAKALS